MKTESIIYFGETKVEDYYLIKVGTSISLIDNEKEKRDLILESLKSTYSIESSRVNKIRKLSNNTYLINIIGIIDSIKDKSITLSNKIGDTFNYKVSREGNELDINIKTYLEITLVSTFMSNLVSRLVEQYGILPTKFDCGYNSINVRIKNSDIVKLGVNPDKEFYYSCIIVEKEVLNIMNAILRNNMR